MHTDCGTRPSAGHGGRQKFLEFFENSLNALDLHGPEAYRPPVVAQGGPLRWKIRSSMVIIGLAVYER